MNRRARIKGIANIPIRRKVEATTNENIEKLESTVSQEQLKNENTPVTNDCANNLLINDINKTEPSSENHEPTQPSSYISSNNSESIKDECQNISSSNTCNIAETDNIKSDESVKTDNSSTNQTVSRRWVPKPKPLVKNPTLLRRPKPVLLPLKETSDTVINQNIENEKPIDTPQPIEEIKSPPPVEIQEKSSTPIDSILKSPTETDRTLTSPLSPNKILNRSRIRPTPKLIRRNSVQGSASESEDDGRRSRIRNDSVCSTASYSTEIVTVKENTIISKDKLISIKVHKLFRRSEQSRKVSEARRDFYEKFGSNIPDRKRLTMMDLIYYNPSSNPMPPRKQNAPTEEIIQPEPETVEEEKADDPEEVEEEDISPVPQVKVGPNGEIILDEQSLVIEQTGTKKGREKLANSQIVNIDDFDRAYGIYKRPKRSKDWSAIETLRFYRSLNTVGTDFSLMVSLFPGRTRRELKMKFKKEEKINRLLIDKALTNPVDFDLSELEKQIKDEEELLKKMEEDKQKKIKPRKPRLKYNYSVLAAQMDEENVDDPTVEKTRKMLRPRREKSKNRYAALHVSELTTSGSDSDSEPSFKYQKTATRKNPGRSNQIIKRDSHEENRKDVVNILLKEENPQINETNPVEDEQNNNDETIDERKTTETNDVKINETIDAELDETNAAMDCDDEHENTEDQNCVVPNILPNDLSTVEPGSLMILSSTGPDGQQIFKVFMVTPGQSKVPVNLSEDVVQSLTTSLGSAQAVTLDLPVINEMENQVVLSDSI